MTILSKIIYLLPLHIMMKRMFRILMLAVRVTSLDLKENNITTIIWSTGFDHDHSYIKLPVFDDKGKLIHKDGIPQFPGLYFLGYPWLRTRKSPILFGIIEDVKFVIDHLFNCSKEKLKPAAIENKTQR